MAGEAAQPPASFESFGLSNSSLSFAVPAEFVEVVAGRVAELLADQFSRDGRPECFVGVDEAAGYLACPKSRVYALVSAGRIPHRKDGSRLLFRLSELDAWLDRGGGRRP